MAQRRMFSVQVVENDHFLDMPLTSQALYFHLGMYADDDGFVTPQKIMRMTGTSNDDLKILVAKQFIIPFESGVIVIRHWRENNYIQSDRYRETAFTEEASKLACIQNVYTLDTQVRLGKVKVSISALPKKGVTMPKKGVTMTANVTKGGNLLLPKGVTTKETITKETSYSASPKRNMRTYNEDSHYEETSIDADSGELVVPKKKSSAKYPDADKIFALFDNPLRSHWRIRPVERDAAQKLFDTLGVERVALRLATIKKYKDHEYCPVITSPSQMVQKMDSMEKFIRIHANS